MLPGMDRVSGVSIEGGHVDREAADAVAGAIAQIFKAGHEARMEQATIVRALDVLQGLGGVKDISISGASIQGPLAKRGGDWNFGTPPSDSDDEE